MPAILQSDPNKPWIIDSMEWDPISSGEGDLLLEDLAKSFAEASKRSEALESNDLASSLNNIASRGLPITNSGAEIKEFDDVNKSVATVNKPMTSSETERIRFCSQRRPASLFSIPPDHHRDVSNSPLKPLLSKCVNVVTDSVKTVTSSTASESKLNCSDVPEIGLAPVMIQEVQNISSQKSNISNTDSILQKCKEVEAASAKQNDSEVSAQSNDVAFVSETTLSMMVDEINTDSDLQNVMEPISSTKMDLKDQSNRLLTSSDCSIEEALEVKECEESNKKEALHSDEMVDLDSGYEGKDGDDLLVRCPTARDGLPVEEKMHAEVECCKQETNIHLSNNSDGMPLINPSERISSSSDSIINDSMFLGNGMELQVKGETHAKANYLLKTATKSGKQRLQQRGYYRFPFKHLLQVPFKRKAVAFKHKSRKR